VIYEAGVHCLTLPLAKGEDGRANYEFGKNCFYDPAIKLPG